MNFSQFWRLEVKTSSLHDWILVRAFFQVADSQLLVFSLSRKEGERILTNSIQEGSTSRTQSPPKAPPHNSIPLGVRILTYEFEGDTNIQFMAGLVMQTPSVQHMQKFQTFRSKEDVQHKPYCLYKEPGCSELHLPVREWPEAGVGQGQNLVIRSC